LRIGTRFLGLHLAGLLALCAAAAHAAPRNPAAKADSTKKAAVSRPAAKPAAKPASKTFKPAPKPIPSPVVVPKPVAAPPPDTTWFGRPISDSATVGTRVYEYIAYPTLQLATWPIQNILAPGVELLTYPSQEPIRYFLEENVIDRTVDLFSFGRDRDIMIYPSISLASGTSSRVGAVLRDQAPFQRSSERLMAAFNYYVNGDYRFRTYLTANDMGETRFDGKLAFGVNRIDNTQFYQPDVNTLYFYAANSEIYTAQLDHPLLLGFNARGGFTLRANRHHDAPPSLFGSNVLTGDFFIDPETGTVGRGEYRGLNETFLDRIYQATLFRDTRNNVNIPVAGSWFDVSTYWHDADKNHDFYEWRGRYTKFFKLGRERYEISAAEERTRGARNLDSFIRDLELQRLRQQIFSRKVVVAHVVAAQSYELPGNSMPVYGLQTLGNDTPLRGYSGPRFRNYAVTAASLEYRFPILRIMDGSLFNEYGVYGRSLDELDIANLKNSWGFGIRVRRPDMFLFRVEVGIHGFSGMTLNATADAPF